MTGREETNENYRTKIQKKVTGNKVLEGFYYDMDAAGLEQKTCYAYIMMVENFLHTVDKPLEDIGVADINRYFHSLKKGDKPQTYLRTLWYCLHRFFGYLMRAGEIEENILEKVVKPKAKPHREVQRTFFTPQECRDIIHAAEMELDDWECARNTAILRLLIETGIRVSALTEINLEDIHPRNYSIRITDKENKTTECPISLDMMKDLLDWLNQRKITPNRKPDEPALFLTSRGTRLKADGVRKMMLRYADVVPGKRLSPHKLRASFANNLLKATGNIRFVQTAMNHADISTTQIYVQTDETDRRAATDIMSQLLKEE